MDPRDFNQTAEEIVNLPSMLESNFRSAISRAYYSNFVLIQSATVRQAGAGLLKRAQLSSQLGHEWVISALINSNNTEIQAIGKNLFNLSYARKCSDYNMSAKIEKADALRELQNAKLVHSAIDTFGLPKIVAYLIQHIRDLAQTRTGNPRV